MIWLIFVAVAFVFIAKNIFVDDDGLLGNSFIDYFVGGMTVLLMTLLVGAVCAGGAVLIGTLFDTHPEQTAEYKLAALRDKEGLTGQFFLGTGEIKGDTYYFYYKQLSDGGLQPGKVYADQGVRVYEEDRKDAILTEFTWVFSQPWAWLVAVPVKDGGYSHDFHVPKGTVRRGYTM